MKTINEIFGEILRLGEEGQLEDEDRVLIGTITVQDLVEFAGDAWAYSRRNNDLEEENKLLIDEVARLHVEIGKKKDPARDR